MVTRTCDLRRFYLRPDPVVNQIVRYCLFRVAAKYGVLLHAASFESNHFHLVLTDTTGRLDLFMAWLDRCIAKCLLQYLREQYPDRHTGTIWCDQSFSDLLLTNHAAVQDKLCYTVLNCVKDRLVPDYKQWPGVLHGPSDWLKPPMEVSRPEYFCDQTGDAHAVATGRFVPPPQFGDRPLPGLVEDFRQQLNRRQLELVTEARTAGQGYVGVKKILATDPFDATDNVRPKGKRNPTVAAGGDREAYKKAVDAVRDHRRRYRQAWKSYRRGLDAIFPGGTLLMRHRYRQPCEPLDCWWCVCWRGARRRRRAPDSVGGVAGGGRRRQAGAPVAHRCAREPVARLRREPSGGGACGAWAWFEAEDRSSRTGRRSQRKWNSLRSRLKVGSRWVGSLRVSRELLSCPRRAESSTATPQAWAASPQRLRASPSGP